MANEITARLVTDTVGEENAASTTEALEKDTSTSSEVDNALSTEEELNAIPQKFVGKAPIDIIKSYSNLEKQYGKISSERALEKKALEDAQARAQRAEQELQQARSYSAPSNQPTVQETDPLADFDKRFNEEPAEAIKSGIASAHEAARRAEQMAELRANARMANDHYNRLKSSDEDFRNLEPDMIAIAQRYSSYLRPEAVNTPEVINLLYSIAKGNKIAMFEQRALEKAKKSGELVREEKRKTFSESSNSQGEGSIPFEDLSLEDMAKVLGRSDK